jgi:hypothetical protein
MDVGVPLARWSLTELHREVLARGVVATISGTTLWRWLDADAIRPWRHRTWVFPRDPQFAERRSHPRSHHRRWENCHWGHDYVMSADEKTSTKRVSAACLGAGRLGEPLRVEHEYRRHGAGPIGRVGRASAACSDCARHDPASRRLTGSSTPS